ncbi:MAG: hypothetical protein ACP5FL_03550 [Thermoplasmatota archaeon]
MYNWLEKHWKLSIAAGIWIGALLIISIWYTENPEKALIFTALIGPIIAIGPPALYYFYIEHIKQPRIVFGKISLDVAPMFFFPEVPLARPAIFLKVTVRNEGRATAKNCKVQVWYNNNDDKIFYARWGLIENPEAYSLLPGERKEIHLLKVFISPDAYFLERKETYDALSEKIKEIPSRIRPPGNPPASFKHNFQEDGFPEFTVEDVNPIVLGPGKRPVMEKRKITRGGWRGNWGWCESGKEYSFKLQAIAEDYKTGKTERKDWSWKLPDDLIEAATKDGDEDIWQSQWEEQGYKKFKQKVKKACKEWLQK